MNYIRQVPVPSKNHSIAHKSLSILHADIKARHSTSYVGDRESISLAPKLIRTPFHLWTIPSIILGCRKFTTCWFRIIQQVTKGSPGSTKKHNGEWIRIQCSDFNYSSPGVWGIVKLGFFLCRSFGNWVWGMEGVVLSSSWNWERFGGWEDCCHFFALENNGTVFP